MTMVHACVQQIVHVLCGTGYATHFQTVVMVKMSLVIGPNTADISYNFILSWNPYVINHHESKKTNLKHDTR